MPVCSLEKIVNKPTLQGAQLREKPQLPHKNVNVKISADKQKKNFVVISTIKYCI